VKDAKLVGRCPYCDHPISREKTEEAQKTLQKERDAAVLAEKAKVLQLQTVLHDIQRKLEAPRRLGRPTKPPVAGERIQIGVQVTPDVKARLDVASEGNHRSLSREAEFRLERSFDHQDLLTEALTLAYGRRMAGILMALGFVMDAAARLTQPNTWNPFRKDWTDKPDLFDHAVRAATTLLDAARPEGAIPERKPGERDPGSWLANQLILALRGDNPECQLEVADDIKRLLGPIAERMAKEKSEEPARTEMAVTPAHNPFSLAINVCRAAQGLDDFSRNRHPGSSALPAEPVAEILERYLANFLLPDWQQKRGDEDKYYWSHGSAPEDVLAAELMRRRA
jgi:hypothetical protein